MVTLYSSCYCELVCILSRVEVTLCVQPSHDELEQYKRPEHCDTGEKTLWEV